MTIDKRIQIAREGKKTLQLTIYKAPCLEGVNGTVIKTGDDSFMVIINSDLPPQEQAAAKERYRDALLRHLLAYLDDPESVDEESGILHRKHAECNLAFLAELERVKNG